MVWWIGSALCGIGGSRLTDYAECSHSVLFKSRAVEAPKYHPDRAVRRDRKALSKELAPSQAMTKILAEQCAQCRGEGEALIRKADKLACQSWNEKMCGRSG
jgi:histone acetyltransferase (RNA polymerase elongator complex component)